VTHRRNTELKTWFREFYAIWPRNGSGLLCISCDQHSDYYKKNTQCWDQ